MAGSMPDLRFNIVANDETAAVFSQVMSNEQRMMAGITGSSAAANRGIASTNQHVAQLGYQVTDVAMMLASGQNPFMLMMQQGGQAAAAISGAGVKSVGGALGLLKTTLGSLLNPISLMTYGFIGLAGVAVGWITNALSGGRDLNDLLDESRALIDQVGDAYDAAKDSAVDFGVESGRVLETLLRGNIVTLRSELEKLNQELALSGAGWVDVWGTGDIEVQAQFAAFAAEIEAFQAAVANGTGDVLAFRDAVAAVAAADPANETLQTAANTLLTLSNNAASAARTIAESENALVRAGQVAAGQVPAMEAYADAMERIAGIAMPAMTDREQADALYRQMVDAATTLDEVWAARAAQTAAYQRIAAQEAAEAAEEWARAADDRARAEAERLANLKIESAKLIPVNDNVADSMENIRDGAEEVGRALIRAFSDGKLEAEEFLDILRNIALQFADKALGMALDVLFAGSGATGGGGFLSRLFAGAFAAGGTIPAGQFGIAGEAGPELITGPARVTPLAGGGVSIQIINNSNENVRAEPAGRGPDGRQIIRVMVGEVGRAFGRGEMDGVMRERFGAVPVRRGR